MICSPDKLNEGNPLYVASINVIDGANAYDNGDYIRVGRSVLGIGVMALMTAITLKGAKTTRGPPVRILPCQPLQFGTNRHPLQKSLVCERQRHRNVSTPMRQRLRAFFEGNGLTAAVRGSRRGDIGPTRSDTIAGAHVGFGRITHCGVKRDDATKRPNDLAQRSLLIPATTATTRHVRHRAQLSRLQDARFQIPNFSHSKT